MKRKFETLTKLIDKIFDVFLASQEKLDDQLSDFA